MKSPSRLALVCLQPWKDVIDEIVRGGPSLPGGVPG